jgi:hypothetical protein
MGQYISSTAAPYRSQSYRFQPVKNQDKVPQTFTILPPVPLITPPARQYEPIDRLRMTLASISLWVTVEYKR